MQQNPTFASFLGDRRWNDKWEDASLANIERQRQHTEAVLKSLAAIDRALLPTAEQLNYDLFKRQNDEALQEFKTLLEKNPDYTPAYFMAAQTLEKAGRIDDAKRMLVDGISSARRTGNAHAQSEMTAMLESL